MNLKLLAKLGAEMRNIDNAHEVYRNHLLKLVSQKPDLSMREHNQIAVERVSNDLGISKQEVENIIYLRKSLNN